MVYHSEHLKHFQHPFLGGGGVNYVNEKYVGLNTVTSITFLKKKSCLVSYVYGQVPEI